MGVDDVHLLDDLSIFVLHQIVQRRAAKVMFTVRDGEPRPRSCAGSLEGRSVRPTGRTAPVPQRNRRAAVFHARRIGRPECSSALVEADEAATFCICATSSSRRSLTNGLCGIAVTGGGWASPSCPRAWPN